MNISVECSVKETNHLLFDMRLDYPLALYLSQFPYYLYAIHEPYDSSATATDSLS